ncbi:hypothetical protein [Paenibacillus glacialis]|uniref:hypothetical protein n=1 Tax=Paenibacillus glacialis TaxID=494026 RepID=UPI000838E6A8|nr:hypothetical protein [Paenibacillus glacialis]
MVETGSKVFYEVDTGNVLVTTPSQIAPDGVHIHSVDELIRIYPVLRDRDQESFDVIELEYGQYAQDFAECNGYRVNPATHALEFSYPDPNEPEKPPVYVKSLTDQVAELKVQNGDLMIAIAEVAEASEIEKTNTQLAIAELAEVIAGGV